MKLLDVNIWLALVLSKHTHHRAARAWLEDQAESASLCFCRVTQQGLVRLLTTAEVLAGYGNPPLSNREAWDVIDGSDLYEVRAKTHIAMERARKDLSVGWTVGWEEGGWKSPLARRWGINAVPTAWLLDSSGRLVSLDAADALEEQLLALGQKG